MPVEISFIGRSERVKILTVQDIDEIQTELESEKTQVKSNLRRLIYSMAVTTAALLLMASLVYLSSEELIQYQYMSAVAILVIALMITHMLYKKNVSALELVKLKGSTVSPLRPKEIKELEDMTHQSAVASVIEVVRQQGRSPVVSDYLAAKYLHSCEEVESFESKGRGS